MSSGIETMTFTTPGQEPVTVTGDAFERAASRIAELAAGQQLSFDVGGEPARPTGASISITGKGVIRSQLFIDDDLTIQIVDANGEIVASFDGSVVDVAFKKHDATEAASAWVERAHKIKLGDREG